VETEVRTQMIKNKALNATRWVKNGEGSCVINHITSVHRAQSEIGLKAAHTRQLSAFHFVYNFRHIT